MKRAQIAASIAIAGRISARTPTFQVGITISRFHPP
jgi:hypothetical protein